MKHPEGRVLTIRVAVKDAGAADWLWDSGGKLEAINGVTVTAIAEGDLFSERDRFESALEEIRDIGCYNCSDLASEALNHDGPEASTSLEVKKDG